MVRIYICVYKECFQNKYCTSFSEDRFRLSNGGKLRSVAFHLDLFAKVPLRGCQYVEAHTSSQVFVRTFIEFLQCACECSVNTGKKAAVQAHQSLCSSLIE